MNSEFVEPGFLENGSCKAPAAWPSDTVRRHCLAERANSLVWLGTRDGEEVQVVVLDPEATALERERFADGARRLHALGEHEYITRVVDVDTSGRWYVRSDAPSVELSQIAIFDWTLVERLEFFMGVLEALAVAHAAGVVHGALCIENILVTQQCRPIVTELGIVDVALLVGRDGIRLEDYRLFAAPEVRAGDSFDFTADLYAVGRVLEFLVAGRLLSVEESKEIAFGAHTEFAESLAAIVFKATADEPGNRYSSAHEMMSFVHKILEASRYRENSRPWTKRFQEPDACEAPAASSSHLQQKTSSGTWGQRHWGSRLLQSSTRTLSRGEVAAQGIKPKGPRAPHGMDLALWLMLGAIVVLMILTWLMVA